VAAFFHIKTSVSIRNGGFFVSIRIVSLMHNSSELFVYNKISCIFAIVKSGKCKSRQVVS
jgi:hypothetical protein